MVLTYQSFESNHHKNEDQFVKNLSNPDPGFPNAAHAQYCEKKMVLKIICESMFLSAMISLKYLDHFIIP